MLVVFLGLSLFYRLAPRRPTRFAEVWAAALCATVLLRAGESLFVIYLKDFATLNAVYGAFGGFMALAAVDLSFRMRFHLRRLPLRQPGRNAATTGGNNHGSGGRGLATVTALSNPENWVRPVRLTDSWVFVG